MDILIEILVSLLHLFISDKKLAGDVQASAARQTELDARLQNPAKIQALLLAKKKIVAIKVYREETGATLREAKRGVESIEEQMRLGREQRSLAQESTDEGEMQEVWQQLRAGHKIKAIKAYRVATGVGLKEAKAAVDRMALYTQEAPREPGGDPSAGLVDPERLQHLLRTGRKIQAIKYFREQTGVGLREAKEAVDWLEASMQQEIELRH